MNFIKKTMFFTLSLCILFFSACSSSNSKNSTSNSTSVTNKEITINFCFGERSGIYSGELLNDLPNGYGTFTSSNEAGDSWTYEGNWLNGHFQGQGATTWSSGNKHIGEYSNDYMHGIGIYYENDTIIYQGKFCNGEFIGDDKDSESTSSTNSNETTSSTGSSRFDDNTILDNLNIQEYTWDSKYKNYVSLVITSTSDYVGAFDINMIFYDSDNNPIGSKNSKCDIVEKDIPLLITISNEEKYDHYDYEITPVKSYYKPIVSKLSSSINETEKKLIVSITNNSDYVAKFVECTVLFFKDNKPIGYDYCYCIDSDDSIKPNDTQIGEISKLSDYDSYLLFIDSMTE